jgi:large subunit ribosomal protein L25
MAKEAKQKLIKILEKDLVKILENPSIFSQVIELNENEDATKVILKEVQVNPSNDKPIHVDFQTVSEKTNITINVPLKFTNEEICVGVKQQGGMISHLKNEIELTCNAQNLPEFIEIDMQTIELGSNIMQSQIILPEGVSLSNNILNSQDQPVASVSVTRAALDIDDEISVAEGEEEGAEGSADAAATSEDSSSDSESKE